MAIPTAKPEPAASSGGPSGSSIWNSFMENGFGLGGSDVEGFAAAAAALLVRIAESEARLDLVFDIIHLGADDEHGRLRVDQDGDALVLDHLVELALLVGIFERIGKA